MHFIMTSVDYNSDELKFQIDIYTISGEGSSILSNFIVVQESRMLLFLVKI